jgi:uncharacterized protein YjgD (DUF1641 family)
MMEVEIGFQLEDLFILIKRGLTSLKYLTWSLEQLENLVDWWNDMEPIIKIAVPRIIDFLDDLEQRGYFRVNTAIRETYTKVAAHYTPEDIDAISDGYVLLHGVMRKFANPELMSFFEKLIDLPLAVHLEESKPVGHLGLLSKLRSEECKQGLGVLLELTQALGQLKMKLAQAP